MSEAPDPRDNPELLGQEAAEHAFLSAWNGGRLAHAWLLTGPRGIGKATLAFRIARFVLSQAGQGGGGLFAAPPPTSLAIPNDHAVFRRIASGGHADFNLVERGWADDKQSRRKGEITVDEVRGVGGFMALTPAEGGWRVVIVDAADEMNRNAANAILKVLEEPPKRALMLLVSHSPGRLLPTIRSRCRRLPLTPLSDRVLLELLSRHVGPDEARNLIPLAEGSVGRALSLHAMGGLDLYREMVGLLQSAPKMAIPTLHDFAEKIGRQAESMTLLAELLPGWMAKAARAATGLADPEILAGEGELKHRLVARIGLEAWVVLWEKIGALFERADSVNLDGKQVVLNAFLAIDKACR